MWNAWKGKAIEWSAAARVTFPFIWEDWSALEDDFRTFLLMPGASESIFQQFKA